MQHQPSVQPVVIANLAPELPLLFAYFFQVMDDGMQVTGQQRAQPLEDSARFSPGGKRPDSAFSSLRKNGRTSPL